MKSFPHFTLTAINMKTHLLLLLSAIVSLSVHAQTQGQVTDAKDNQPLPGVNIYLQKDSAGIGATDRDGHFDLSALKKIAMSDTIVFSYVGYLSLRLTCADLRKSDYRVAMQAHAQALPEVSISGEKGRSFLNYEPLEDLPMRLTSPASFVHDGKIFLISGTEKTPVGDSILSEKMLIYDIAADAWTESPRKFARRNGHRAHYYKGKVFVVGGKYWSTNRRLEYTAPQIEIYDMERDTLYVDRVNPHQAVKPATFIYDDCLYVMGGSVKERVYSDKVHTLDLKTGVWYDTGIVIPEERLDFSAGVAVGHVVYFFGGWRMASIWKVRSYNLLTGEWKDLCDLKECVSSPGVATCQDLIYIYENQSLQIYNIRTNRVTAHYFTDGRCYTELFYAGGKLYLVGGRPMPTFSEEDEPTLEPESVFSVDVSHIEAE